MTVNLNPNLTAPELPAEHALRAVLASALKSRPAPAPTQAAAYWPATHFNLSQASLFIAASAEEQTQILSACGRNLLAEAYYIEKSGMYFAAKMSLLADTAQERMLYSLFAADEATHFNWIAQYISDVGEADYGQHPFLTLLNDVLQNEERGTLAYLIQVVLEGWGIAHYHALAKDCLDAGLTDVLAQIIKDEARHHGSGLILCNERAFSAAQLARLVELLQQFFAMVQVGPQMVVGETERVLGPLSRNQKTKLFAELECETMTARKMATLTGLLKNTNCGSAVIAELARRDVLRPFTAAECAAC